MYLNSFHVTDSAEIELEASQKKMDWKFPCKKR